MSKNTMSCPRAQLLLRRPRATHFRPRFRNCIISLFIILHLQYLLGRLIQLETHRRATIQRRRRNKGEFKKAYKQLIQLPRNSTNRIAFITFSYVKTGDTDKLFNFLLPAVDTWAAPSQSHDGTMLYVVLSHESRGPFERNCKSKLCRRLRPIYVDCPEGRYGESPCCKQQKGLLEIFEGRDYPLYDWYGFFDDDIYLRKEYVAQYLRSFVAPHFPMALVPRSNDAKHLGHLDNMCSTGRGDEFKYPWGMPIFYSRGGIGRLAKGLRSDSLVKQCSEFMVSHDVGNQILNWMYSLRIGKLPPMAPLPKMRPDFIGSHWVGRNDMAEAYHLQPRVASKPKLEPLPKDSFSFYKTHEKWSSPELKSPEIQGLFASPEDRWYKNVTGYRQTLTYSHFRFPDSWDDGVWHTMKVSDCNPENMK